MSNNITRQDEMAALKFAENLQKYPEDVTKGVGIVLPNFVNGCSWGFVSDTNEEYRKAPIKSNSKVSSIKIKGGYLVYMDMVYLIDVLKDTAMGYLTPQDLAYAEKHRLAALTNLKKLLKKGYNGKIGIYNLNDTDTITVNGERYPSFCVTIQDLLATAQEMGYKFRFGNITKTPLEVNSVLLKVVENLQIAPSANAMFIDICK